MTSRRASRFQVGEMTEDPATDLKERVVAKPVNGHRPPCIRTDDWLDLDKCRKVCEVVYGGV